MVSSSEDSVTQDMQQVYSEAVIDQALRPISMVEMDNADGFGRVTGPCGDTMEIWLRVEGSVIVMATFGTDGCVPTVASGSQLTELVRGKTIPQALGISQQDVIDALGGLPEAHEHCAILAVNTLREAIRDYLTFKKEPWKRAYRTYRRGS